MRKHLLLGSLLFITLLGGLLRFYHLLWGDGFFFHPDERNMANSVAQMKVEDGLHPHFFAYGQFPLYLAYFSYQIINSSSITQLLSHSISPVPFGDAVFWLRFWSALASTLTIPLVYLITKELLQTPDWKKFVPKTSLLAAFFTAFTPGLIQAAHFGTTESLLTFFFMAIVYLSIKLIKVKRQLPKDDSQIKEKKLATSSEFHLVSKSQIKNSKQKVLNFKIGNWDLESGTYIIALALLSGLALATKLSAIFFLACPILATIFSHFRSYSFNTNINGRSHRCYSKNCLWKVSSFSFKLIGFIFLTLLFLFLTSPYNLIDFREFSRISLYETKIARGEIPIFYTQQFEKTTPILYQLVHIFPYALGWPIFLLGSLGFLFIVFQHYNPKFKIFSFDRSFFIFIFSFLTYFLPNAFLFCKWTRFMTPIVPIFSILAAIFLAKVLAFLNFNFWIVIFHFAFLFSISLPGILFFSIYLKPDVRVEASEWIYKNIPENSYILSETANVVDLPLGLHPTPYTLHDYKVISFNFYDLDRDPSLFEELTDHLKMAQYIFIPSQRIYLGRLRLKEKYPLSARYYHLLFSEALGFTKIAQFSRLNDEGAEETWGVFDHPVIRIYKKVRQFSKEEYKRLLKI